MPTLSRRTVTTAFSLPRRRRVRVFGFTYFDLATFLGMSEQAVRRAVCKSADKRNQRRNFDPTSLASIFEFYQYIQKKRRKGTPA